MRKPRVVHEWACRACSHKAWSRCKPPGPRQFIHRAPVHCSQPMRPTGMEAVLPPRQDIRRLL